MSSVLMLNRKGNRILSHGTLCRKRDASFAGGFVNSEVLPDS